MPDVNAVYQSAFMRASQLGDQEREVIIAAAAVEVLGQGERAAQKIVLDLNLPSGKRVPQRLPLNKSNALALAALFGPDTSNWIGRTIGLRPEKVLFQGALVDAIRVSATRAAAAAPAVSTPAAAARASEQGINGADALNDDIPW
jgi:hypothetical protein